MSKTPNRKCPECNGPMHPIQLLDKSNTFLPQILEYAVEEAKRSFWSGRLPAAGSVGAYMCDECGRLLLYGEPYHE